MQSPGPISSGSTHFCWICGKPVSLENSQTDEYGNLVHDECLTARLKLRQAGSSQHEKAG